MKVGSSATERELGSSVALVFVESSVLAWVSDYFILFCIWTQVGVGLTPAAECEVELGLWELTRVVRGERGLNQLKCLKLSQGCKT